MVVATALLLTIRLEAEEGALTHCRIATTRPGYSGTGYVTGLTESDSSVVWKTKFAPGLYEARLRYSTGDQKKGIEAIVDGIGLTAMAPPSGPGFSSISLGRVAVTGGDHVVEVRKGWGYYDLDALDLVPTEVPAAPKPVPAKLVDGQATPETGVLMRRLTSAYGKSCFSGQYGAEDAATILAATGRTPAIYGADFMDYSPSRVERGAHSTSTEDALRVARGGRIITMSWHWNAPTDLIDRMIANKNGKPIDARWYKGFYTNATTFDFAAALADPNSERYRMLLRDVDAIAVQLKKFDAAHVPVLWRPLHEASGGWFWWGAKGPGPFKQLWRLVYDRLTRVHDLHNLIWVYTAGDPEWYPGDDVVDILGIDAYPTNDNDRLTKDWDDLRARFDGKKLLAITEHGGVPDVEAMRAVGVYWSYFVSWTGRTKGKSIDDLNRTYRAPHVANASVIRK